MKKLAIPVTLLLLTGFAFTAFTDTSISPIIPPYPGNPLVFLNGAAAWTTPAGGSSGTAGMVINTVASAGLLAVDSSKTNGIAATSGHVTNALGYTPLAEPTQVSLTHAGTVTFSFTPVNTEAELSLTGAVTFATSSLAATKNYILFGRNPQATNCTPTFPAWQFQGGAPSTITAGKTFSISLASRGTVDTNVWAFYTESQ